MATQRGAAASSRTNVSRKRSSAAAPAASSCAPPSDQPQEACLPPQPERRRCLGGGGLAPAAHAPPPLSMRDLTRGKAKAPRAPSVAFRIVQDNVPPIWRCPVRLLQRPRTQEQRAPCLRRTCCLAWGLSSLSFVGGRIKRPTGRGGMVVRPRKPTRDGHEFGSMSTVYGGICEERAIVCDRKGLATNSV